MAPWTEITILLDDDSDPRRTAIAIMWDASRPDGLEHPSRGLVSASLFGRRLIIALGTDRTVHNTHRSLLDWMQRVEAPPGSVQQWHGYAYWAIGPQGQRAAVYDSPETCTQPLTDEIRLIVLDGICELLDQHLAGRL